MANFDFAPQERHAETKSCSLFVLYWCKKVGKIAKIQFFWIALICRNFGIFSMLRQAAKNDWGLSTTKLCNGHINSFPRFTQWAIEKHRRSLPPPLRGGRGGTVNSCEVGMGGGIGCRRTRLPPLRGGRGGTVSSCKVGMGGGIGCRCTHLPHLPHLGLTLYGFCFIIIGYEILCSAHYNGDDLWV